ncbi:MAG: Hsp70 family protein [Fulvimarina manganoxydans]|uniref:Hsp70 family protein n=1 Tax=Fulvimarina manganoxydans TaxID=937218 RepID=UPI0023567E56|nr:Hsp70 family protein [Fulvimarina manganoxydans]MCK5931758.1 Hsp70 family protein [Fulvimarina manganoxydans]
MTRFAGLDFGTTNSTLALSARGTAPALVPMEGDHLTIPSALFFSFEDGETYFGRAAVFEYRDGAEGRFMRALKQVLGSKLMEETTQIGRERWSFEALIGRFLSEMRQRLARHLGSESMPEAVVLGRPVRFVDDNDAADRAAEDQLRAAAKAQGFHHIEFQYEPVAAALTHEAHVTREELALVVDIGGGTSDFTLVRLSPEAAGETGKRGSDILATSGVHVGGTDFDRVLSIAEVMPEFGLGSWTVDRKRQLPVWYFNDMATWHRINLLYSPKIRRDVEALRKEAEEPAKLERYAHLLDARSGHRLMGAVEQAKIALTDESLAKVALIEPGLRFEQPVTRDAFNTANSELVTRIVGAIDDCLRLASIDEEAVETLILTGGGAQVPAVLGAATARFPHAAVVQADRFGAVGLGLAIDAARRFS